jgi:Na+(H+)/acetate symporter ActP
MKLFKPNRNTKKAVEHPTRAAVGTGISVFFIVLAGGIGASTPNDRWIAFPVAVALALATGAFIYFMFRQSGPGARWYKKSGPV